MLLVDHRFSCPEENLACDEVLLNHCAADGNVQLLRFWESRSHFVVLGYTKKLHQEVDVAQCRQLGIPIFRRCSGGGTVLQGPGCLNYSLIAQIPLHESSHDISATNCRVMRQQRDALQQLLPGTVTIEGHTDLTWNGLKFSGNAQRRKSRYFLFHGTVLLDFDLDLIQKVLLMPHDQPAYRQRRAHREFITNLPLCRDDVRTAIARQWNVKSTFEGALPLPEIHQLAASKYRSTQWNEKF